MTTEQKKSAHKSYEKTNGVLLPNQTVYGYAKKEQANEYANLLCKWWGSNLVYLGAREIDGYWFPKFNVWN